MEQEGEIISVLCDRAIVRMRRPGPCEHCGACEIGANPETTIEVPNPDKLEAGTAVLLEVDEGEVVKAAALVYIVPLAGLFVGFGVGEMVRRSTGLAEVWTLVFGLAFLGLGLGIVAWVDRRGKSERCLPRMKPAR